MTDKLQVHFRQAVRNDLAAIVELLVDDELGATREAVEQQIAPCYVEAFEAIEADPNNEVIVAESDGSVVGTLQITFAPNLTHKGARRATIEGVRVASGMRSSGLGTRLFEWTIQYCRTQNCRLVQLTTDLRREDAKAFYERLGFEHTHAGMKLWL